MPLYLPTLAVFVLAVIAAYTLWITNSLRRVRHLLSAIAVVALVTTVVLRRMQP
jgi:hypothetical protein